MDKLLAMRMFVETVDAKGFSAAARKLDIATSSVSRMVDALEAELGTVLLNRSTRQVTVSEAGMAYYLSARHILDSVVEADTAIKDSQEEPSGPLRVSVPTAFGRSIIAPHLGRFLARYPRLELDITLTDEIVDLFAERVDLSIRLGSPAPMEEVISRPVGHFKRLVVASSEYLERCGEPQEPEALSSHECLRFNYGAANQVWTFEKDGQQWRIPVQGRTKSNNIEVLQELARSGYGVALLPDWLAYSDVESGLLTQLFHDFTVNPNNASAAISALYLPNHRGSKRVKAFIEFISGILEDA